MGASRPCALATAVEVLGSAYRRPGAHMLVTDDGELTGAISGGCLEGDARQRARRALVKGEPALVTYDTRDEDDPRHGLGPGCQGVVRILLEPLNFQDDHNPLEILRSFAQHPAAAALATVFETDATGPKAAVGQRLLLAETGVVRGAPTLAAPLAEAAYATLTQGQSRVLDLDTDAGPARVLLEVLPPLRLVVYGAGNDAQPLVHLGASLGWHITVVDGRPNLTTAARFPEAAAVRLVPVRELEAAVPDLLAYHVLLPDAHFHVPGQAGPLRGPAGYLTIVHLMRSGLPDIHWTLENLVAEGNQVAARFTMRGTHQGAFFGVPPTGKSIVVPASDFYRFAGGQIVEEHGQPDMLSLLQQIGAVAA